MIDLDHPAKEYAPEISEIQVLEGFDDDGEPRLRPPASDVTVEQLMLHTAGFGYDFFNHDLVQYGEKRDVPSVVSATQASLNSALLFDPGERWEYGRNIDWVGKVVEGARGKRLGEVMRERIFEPLGIGHRVHPTERCARGARACTSAGRRHAHPDAGLRAAAGPRAAHGRPRPVRHGRRLHEVYPDGPERRARGSTAACWRPRPCGRMAQNGLGETTIKVLPGAIPTLSNDAEFFPGMPKGWSLHLHGQRRGRAHGSPGRESSAGRVSPTSSTGSTAQNGVGGFWATQILPVRGPDLVRRLHGVRDRRLQRPEVRHPGRRLVRALHPR